MNDIYNPKNFAIVGPSLVGSIGKTDTAYPLLPALPHALSHTTSRLPL